MGGFLGIGGSSANTDRGNQLAATQGDWSIFNYGLPTGQQQQAQGSGTLNTALTTLGPAQNYFDSLLSGGRTQAQQLAGPAINATIDQGNSNRNANANFGTGRTGGTAPTNQQAGTQTQSQIDNIISSTLNTGRQQGAAGLQGISSAQAGIGGTQLSDAMSLLGLGSGAVNDILTNSTNSRATSYDINQNTQEQFGNIISGLLGLFHI